MKGLTPKQGAFVQEYLVDLNAAAAARRAGYSKRSARETGPENLLKPVIAKAIQELMVDRQKRTEITTDKVLTDIEEVRLEAREESNHSAALKASELQGRHLQMFVDRVQIGFDGDIAMRLELAYRNNKS